MNGVPVLCRDANRRVLRGCFLLDAHLAGDHQACVRLRDGRIVGRTEFETMAGNTSRKWQQSIRVVLPQEAGGQGGAQEHGNHGTQKGKGVGGGGGTRPNEVQLGRWLEQQGISLMNKGKRRRGAQSEAGGDEEPAGQGGKRARQG